MAKSQSSKVAPKASSMKKVSVKKTGATLKKAANQKSEEDINKEAVRLEFYVPMHDFRNSVKIRNCIYYLLK